MSKDLETAVWGAVRKCRDDGEEWIDTQSMSCDPETLKQRLRVVAGQIPLWDEVNPVIRIGLFRVSEEKTEGVRNEHV